MPKVAVAGVDANRCSTIGAAGRHVLTAAATVRRAAAGRFGGRADEGIIGQGGGPSAGDGVGADGHADLARSGGTGPQDLHKGGAGGDAEDEAHGQECELAGGHAAGISRVVLLP